jgi:flavodoxin
MIKLGSQMLFLFTKITIRAVIDSMCFVEFCNQNYPFDFMMKIFTFPYRLPFIYFAYICEKRNRINAYLCSKMSTVTVVGRNLQQYEQESYIYFAYFQMPIL